MASNNRQKKTDNYEQKNKQDSTNSSLNYKISDLFQISEETQKPNFKRLKQILDEEESHSSNDE